MKLILFILFSFPTLTLAKTPEDVKLRESIRHQLIQEEKECADCGKMRPEVLEREVDRIYASEKNKKRQKEEAQNEK